MQIMMNISSTTNRFDTLRGVRGELQVQVKLQFFGDINPFKDSSAGVQFFSMSRIPQFQNVSAILGFVEVLDNEDDPEYHWTDNFRTPRTSNEERMRCMFRLSGQIRRKLGRRVLEMNGNAVLGFRQYFDLESEKHLITIRAIGTAVRLVQPDAVPLDRGPSWLNLVSPASNVPMTPPLATNLTMDPISSLNPPIALNSKPLANNDDLPIMSSSPSNLLSTSFNIPTSAPAFKPLEQQLLTLKIFPSGCIVGIGGLVSAMSVKILDNDEREVRDAWWTELRDEIKSHGNVLGCSIIAGYTETTTINDDLCVLHCSGTAITLDMNFLNPFPPEIINMSELKRTPSIRSGEVKVVDALNSPTRAIENSISEVNPSLLIDFPIGARDESNFSSITSDSTSKPKRHRKKIGTSKILNDPLKKRKKKRVYFIYLVF